MFGPPLQSLSAGAVAGSVEHRLLKPRLPGPSPDCLTTSFAIMARGTPMTKAALRERIVGLQAELELLKKAIIKEPDFEIDERNWRRIRSSIKRTRKKLYQRRYGRGKR